MRQNILNTKRNQVTNRKRKIDNKRSGKWIWQICTYVYIYKVHMYNDKYMWMRKICVSLLLRWFGMLCPVLQKTNSQQCYKSICTCIIPNRSAIAQCVTDIHSHIVYIYIAVIEMCAPPIFGLRWNSMAHQCK